MDSVKNFGCHSLAENNDIDFKSCVLVLPFSEIDTPKFQSTGLFWPIGLLGKVQTRPVASV